MSYKYTDPKELGYVQFKLNNREHLLMYSKYRLNSIFRRNRYWINNTSIYVENQIPTPLFKLLLTVGFPFMFLYYFFMIGAQGIPELLDAYKKDLYFPFKYGTFSSDTSWKTRGVYEEGKVNFKPMETYTKIYSWLEITQPKVIQELKKNETK